MYHNRDEIKGWMSSFNEDSFQTELQNYRNEIETLIKNYIKSVKEKNEIMLFDSVESRIKSDDSFEQKLSRKDYIYNWKLDTDLRKNQEYIKLNLSDVIGFRISCYFKKDEKTLYTKILEDGIKDVSFLKTDTEQENGHEIWKIEGLYKNECRFELQIKSLLHNVWGEVDHKTIYKPRAFDCNYEDRSTITEGTYNILLATDTQLDSLFKMNYDIDKMIKSLFYELTKEHVCKEFNTDILGKAYNQFFSIFYKEYKNEIRDYVGRKLLGQTIEKKVISFDLEKSNIEKFKKSLSDSFLHYEFELVQTISEEIVSYKKSDYFYNLIFSLLSPTSETYMYEDEEAFYEENDDDTYEEFEKDKSTKADEDIINVVFERLKGYKFKEVKSK